MELIKYGVPQGSILGPVLFLCYINGLPKIISDNNNKMCLYADDSNLITSHKSLNELENLTNCKLSSISNYFSGKTLLLNPEKTNFIWFRTQQNRNVTLPIIKINDQQIKHVDKIKFLGLMLDKNLTWNSHIQHINNKISSGLYALKSVSKYCNIETLKMIYYSHIHSHISFGIVLYGATCNANLQQILVFQKKAIRIILKLKDQDSVKHLFSHLGIMTIYGLYIMETVLVVKQASDRLPKLGSVHGYSTRNRNQLAAPQINLQVTTKKPVVAGIKFYKKLPYYLQDIENLLKFKKELKRYLISKALYSFDEFFLG